MNLFKVERGVSITPVVFNVWAHMTLYCLSRSKTRLYGPTIEESYIQDTTLSNGGCRVCIEPVYTSLIIALLASTLSLLPFCRLQLHSGCHRSCTVSVAFPAFVHISLSVPRAENGVFLQSASDVNSWLILFSTASSFMLARNLRLTSDVEEAKVA